MIRLYGLERSISDCIVPAMYGLCGWRGYAIYTTYSEADNHPSLRPAAHISCDVFQPRRGDISPRRSGVWMDALCYVKHPHIARRMNIRLYGLRHTSAVMHYNPEGVPVY